MASASGESARHSELSIPAASTKAADASATNSHVSRREMRPVGSSRPEVLGLRASNS